jgi:hypothetical protein
MGSGGSKNSNSELVGDSPSSNVIFNTISIPLNQGLSNNGDDNVEWGTTNICGTSTICTSVYSQFTIQDNKGFTNLNNLADIINTFGNNVPVKLNVNVNGEWGGHDCNQGRSLSLVASSDLKQSFLVAQTNVNDVGEGTFTFSTDIIPYSGPANNIPGQLYLYNIPTCSGAGCGCRVYGGWSKVNIVASFTAIVNIASFCTGSNFTNLNCINWCDYSDNQTTCFNNAIDYCFTKDTIGSAPMVTPTGTCQNFFTTYLSQIQGGNSQLDTKLTNLCKDLGVTPDNFSTQSQNIKDLCGCHLDATNQTYVNYYNYILSQVPGLQFGGETSPKCIFPGCSTAKFRSADILGSNNQCPQVQCIQGVTINNQGQIGGNVNIDQSCVSYITKGGGKTCTSNADCNDPTLICSGLTSGNTTGVCVKGGAGTSPGTSPGPSPGPGCNTDSDCGRFQYCDPNTSQCLYNRTELGFTIAGSILVLLLLIGGIIFLIYYFRKKQKQ